MGEPRIPLGKPTIEGNELDYVRAAVESGCISSGGAFTARCSELLSHEIGAQDVLLTTSCTAALEMAAMLLDLGPGDRVVVPSFTFVSTALAFARTGAEIVFCDIESRTLGLDPDHLATLIDDRVKAIVPVHYAGVSADMAGIEKVIGARDIAVVEDNAHGLFGTSNGRPLGSMGRFSTLSFHETKNFVCGEGGALVVNRPADVERAHVLLDKGTNRRAFFNGEVDRYTWLDTGSSFGLSEILAAYLWAQLEHRDEVLARRRRVHELYDQLLRPHADGAGIRLPVVPAGAVSAFHMYYVLLEDRTTRDRVLDEMRAAGITAAFHYVPLHSSPGAAKIGASTDTCPVTDEVAGRLLRLPFHNDLTECEVGTVVATLLDSVTPGGHSAGSRPRRVGVQA